MALSLITGGQYIRLQRAKLLSQVSKTVETIHLYFAGEVSTDPEIKL